MEEFPLAPFCGLRQGLRILGIIDIVLGLGGFCGFVAVYLLPGAVNCGTLLFHLGMFLTLGALAGYLLLGILFIFIAFKMQRMFLLVVLILELVFVFVHIGGLVLLTMPATCTLDEYAGLGSDALQLCNLAFSMITLCTYKLYQIYVLSKSWKSGIQQEKGSTEQGEEFERYLNQGKESTVIFKPGEKYKNLGVPPPRPHRKSQDLPTDSELQMAQVYSGRRSFIHPGTSQAPTEEPEESPPASTIVSETVTVTEIVKVPHHHKHHAKKSLHHTKHHDAQNRKSKIRTSLLGTAETAAPGTGGQRGSKGTPTTSGGHHHHTTNNLLQPPPASSTATDATTAAGRSSYTTTTTTTHHHHKGLGGHHAELESGSASAQSTLAAPAHGEGKKHSTLGHHKHH